MGTDGEPPTIFMEGTGCVVWDVDIYESSEGLTTAITGGEPSYMEALGERMRGAMGLEKMAAIARRYRTWTVLFALVTTFAGVALIVDRPKGTILEWFALPLVAIGGAVFAWAVWPVSRPPVRGTASLASRFLQRVTFDGRIIRFFPAIGVGLILADVAYNLTVSATPTFQTEDTIVLLSAVAFLGYG